MIVDPVEVFKTQTYPLIPTSTASPTFTPLPTVIPHLPEVQEIGHSGKVTLWVVFVIFLISSAAFAGLSWRVPVSRRLYHTITTLITIIATLSYFALATGHGASWNKIVVTEKHEHVPDTYKTIYRQVFWARYVDWALTTPLLLLDLSLIAGLSGAYILMAIIADVIMVLTGLFAAFGTEGTPQKWGWFAMALIAYLVVIWHLVVNGRASARAKGDKASKFFLSIMGFTLILWTIYPIVWGVAEGGRHASVNTEVIIYAVVDILAKTVFGAWLLLTHAKLPEIGIETGGFWTNGIGAGEGRVRLDDDEP
ncbi:family A G protein-coupled receptor-like protein [Patellaria atrata CBS 101060]|uniref:Family A G protein-coupled receptor-like protein n=1 Tax=Patellaria atrata CBS 101060 TaxID=1346257 RepID=A0A9P4VR18_9PEZI|nr:family A G protein-coupled receptor-like protein [Patellaria atrata CBS 101060]